jgi:hypothetical protein
VTDVKLHTYGQKRVRVSTQWLVTLKEADRHVSFVVNSGARTEAEQKDLIRRKGCWSPSNRTGAACPWFKSNHVVKNAPNHALDVDNAGDGENELQAWLNGHRFVKAKVLATNPVPGEPWHLEINRAGLFRLWLKYHPRQRRQKTRTKKVNRAAAAGVPRDYAGAIYDLARKHKVQYALALALFRQESNFSNVVGHDRDSHGNLIFPAQPGRVAVTEQLYKEYRRRGGLPQGMGPGQLTSKGFQDSADRRGGTWKPRANMDVSLEVLRGNIQALGRFKGIGAYNGGRGNPNDAYARSVEQFARGYLKALKG